LVTPHILLFFSRLKLSDVCTKYQEAAKIVNLALTGIVSQCVSGAKIVDICQFGTAVLDAQVGKLYNKKVDGMPVEKGIAFPVCISVNEVVCNMSPLASDEMVSSKIIRYTTV
jgi:methionine aminopeptidase